MYKMKISNRIRASAKYWATTCKTGSKAKPPEARKKKRNRKRRETREGLQLPIT